MSSIGLATFAAGCFWDVEETFASAPGVFATSVGYTGGTVAHPTYEQVESGRTGHVEAVLVDFDATRISYDELLALFLASHDPVQRHRPTGRGSQHRSMIFVHNPEQRDAALAACAALERTIGRSLATQIARATLFYRAEECPQRHFERASEVDEPSLVAAG